MVNDPKLDLWLAKQHIDELAREHRSVKQRRSAFARERKPGQRLTLKAVLVSIMTLFMG
jgi:hypothetical protein